MYKYKEGKSRVVNILHASIKVDEIDSIPKNDSKWTYANGVKSWVTAVFVDLRDSTELFKENSIKVSKVIRAYSSEIIDILNSSDLMREIGIRGDAVYAIYSSPNKNDINEIFTLVCYVNTYMKMLSKLLSQNGFSNVRAGIGMATSNDLIIKVGRKHTGINDRVWIGKALAEADRLSKITNLKRSSGFTNPIAVSLDVYSNIRDLDNNEKFLSFDNNNDCYKSKAVIDSFNKWINGGMK